MVVRPWLLLVVLLSAGGRLSAVDVNWLTHVVKTLRTEYRISSQFCIAANIPLTQNYESLTQILQRHPYQQISNSLEEAEVYESNDIVIAKHIEADPVHAERKVLLKLPTLKRNRSGNFLLIYSYLSPCRKCTDWNLKYNVVRTLYTNVQDWSDAAFVFTRVYDKPQRGQPITRTILEASLTDLGDSMHGLNKVYRCHGATNAQLSCHSCSIQSRISEVCVNNNAASPQIIQSEGGGSSSRGRDSSSSSSSRGRDSSSDGGSRSSSSSGSSISIKRGRYNSPSDSSRSSSNQGRS